METHYAQLLETSITVIVYVLLRFIIGRIIAKTIRKRLFHHSRSKIIKTAINVLLTVLLVAVILAIWGVKQTQLAFYLGSILTVIGVAMFAQWSLLSNITSSIIMFFYHNVRIDDTVTILETKDYELTGKIEKIGLFFTVIVIEQTGEIISMPNNIFILKTIKKVNPDDEVEPAKEKEITIV